MTAADVLFAIGLIAGLVEEYNARGRSIIGWGLIAVCVGLLFNTLTSL